jgi:hypothetical protein
VEVTDQVQRCETQRPLQRQWSCAQHTVCGMCSVSPAWHEALWRHDAVQAPAAVVVTCSRASMTGDRMLWL